MVCQTVEKSREVPLRLASLSLSGSISPLASVIAIRDVGWFGVFDHPLDIFSSHPSISTWGTHSTSVHM